MNELFSEFPEIPTEAWEEKIRSDLKDSNSIEKLSLTTDEGIVVKPFYRQEDLGSLSYLKNVGNFRKSYSAPNGWSICQDIPSGEDPAKVQQMIKEALMGGAQSIRFRFNSWTNPDFSDLGTLLEGVHLGETELMFQGSIRADALYDSLCELTAVKGIARSNLTGCLGADPLGFMVISGIPIASFENLGRLMQKVSTQSPAMRVIDVHGGTFQDSGSNLAEELAFTLAMANEYMSLLSEKGFDPGLIQANMQLSLSTGPDFFMEIAKLRAARILWATIAQGHGMPVDQARILLHSTTSSWNQTLYDPYVNMLRGTSEAMSSILGGADYLSVLPYDHPYGSGTGFSNRIARNVQIILREEAYLDRVSDPSSGSYYIDSLTDSIGEKAWDLFREVESMGGFRVAFEQGWIQQRVHSSKKKRWQRIASGEDHLIGTNAFPNFNETILAGSNNSMTANISEPYPDSLVPFRPSSLFEEVRLAVEKSEKRPRVLLFQYGDPVWTNARATFSANFFGCAGYSILEPAPFSSIKSGIKVIRDTKAEVVVLCSSDDHYISFAPLIQEEVGQEALLVIAGYPLQDMDQLKNSGITHFVHRKSNLLETLKEFNAILL